LISTLLLIDSLFNLGSFALRWFALLGSGLFVEYLVDDLRR